MNFVGNTVNVQATKIKTNECLKPSQKLQELVFENKTKKNMCITS